MWGQNFLLTNGVVRWRRNDNIPPAGFHLSSPYDPEAHDSHKRSVTGVGEKVHLTETYAEERPHSITNIRTEEAGRNDN